MLLTVKNRQKYLKYLGLYAGSIDGIEGKMTKAGYLALQKKFFTRKSDIDGLYGNNTDILLRNAYSVEYYTRNFDLPEFKCGCGGKYCTGYPTILDPYLLTGLQSIRSTMGPTTITSGMRCQRYNDSLPGSIKTSKHTKGKAIDFYNSKTDTVAERQSTIAYCKKLPRYTYAYGNINGSHPNMGNAVHFDVK